MKVAYKLALIITGFVLISTILLVITFDLVNHRSHEKVIYDNIENNTFFITGQIEEHLTELTVLTQTIANIDSLKDDLAVSNAEFGNLSLLDREALITNLNNTWMDTSDLSDPFIQERMNNDFALYLDDLAELNSDLYGEAFVTNKYGVMISTTGKLTTLAHYDKYWWQGAYNEGEGIIYLDDRGYDESVEGYVLGIVVPIIENDEIIGMLKVNFNIHNILSSTMTEMSISDGYGDFQIVRSLGLIVSKGGIEPLSEEIDEKFLPILLLDELTVGEISIQGEDCYYGFMPIGITLDSDDIIFGGSYDSIDHSLGNLGENWNIIYTLSDNEANVAVHEVLILVIYGSLILIFLIFVFSFVIAKKLSKPVINLHQFVKEIGTGNLSSRLEITSKDEIGALTGAFNEMLDNLNNTLISKAELETEIFAKSVLEKKLLEISRIDELTKIYNRRAFNDFFNSYYERAIRYNESLAVIIFDIDEFKHVNDKYGHLIGDSVLVKLSVEIKKLVRVSDIFARWGGEEFIILVPNIKRLQVLEFSERIRKTFSEIDFGLENFITISLGIGMMNGKDSKDKILKKADDALYKAKSEGKNKSIVIK